MNKQKAALGTVPLLLMFLSTPSVNADISGNINVSLNITPTCLVSNVSSGVWGAMEFGTVSNLNADIPATVGTNGLSVVCSPNTVASLTLNAGANGTSSLRRLSNGATTNPTLITYRLYSDAGHNSEIAINTPITLPTGTGVAQNIPIYGLIRSSDNTANLYPTSGSYVDTISATLTWN